MGKHWVSAGTGAVVDAATGAGSFAGVAVSAVGATGALSAGGCTVDAGAVGVVAGLVGVVAGLVGVVAG